MVDSPSRPILALLADVSEYSFSEPIQSSNIATDIPVSSSNEHMLSVEEVLSQSPAESGFLEPTHDSLSLDGSCSGLAEIQVRAINFFLLRTRKNQSAKPVPFASLSATYNASHTIHKPASHGRTMSKMRPLAKPPG